MAAGALSLLMASGCQPPKPGPTRVDNVPLESNIIEVGTFYNPNPFGPVGGGTKPGGFIIRELFLFTPNEKGAPRGVFGDGIIHVYMYDVTKGPDGKPGRKLVREWVYDVEQARPYRSKRLHPILGQGYQLHCAWGDADVLGKNVEIDVQFERNDGRIISSSPKGFIVPKE